MRLCKYCEQPMDKSSEAENRTACAHCSRIRADVLRFVEICDWFKRRINYDAILRKRKKEAEKNDQGTTASV